MIKDGRRQLRSIAYLTERNGCSPNFEDLVATSGRTRDETAQVVAWLAGEGYVEITPEKVVRLTGRGRDATM